jgi:Uncharacterised nucleotidyltransferase
VRLTSEKRQALVTRLALGAASRAVDRVTAEIVISLRDAGVRPIVLKGPVFERWLYGATGVRTYGDTDVLVAPGQVEIAVDVLTSLGFSLRALSRYNNAISGGGGHGQCFARGGMDGELVDLHSSVVGAAAEREAVWSALSRDTESIEVAGVDVEGTGVAANALIVALHAAAHGAGHARTQEDLARALDRADIGTWRDAHALAVEVDAVECFAAGLRTLPAGAEVAAVLGLPDAVSADVVLRAYGAPRGAVFIARLRAAGWRTRTRLVARAVFPGNDYIREWSALRGRAHDPPVVGYVRRLAERLRTVVPAMRAVTAARERELNSRADSPITRSCPGTRSPTTSSTARDSAKRRTHP